MPEKAKGNTMTTEKMISKMQNVYRMLEKADNDETPSQIQIGCLIIAIADLAETVEGLIENDIAHTHSAGKHPDSSWEDERRIIERQNDLERRSI